MRSARFSAARWLGLICVLAATAVRAELFLTNYTTSKPLNIMPVGDSITDDCSFNGAWRLYLEPLLKTNDYAFTNLGRFVSTATSTFTKTRHEGICGAVIGFPGMFAWHGYPAVSNYALTTLADALTNSTPDLFLIDLGVNDLGYGRNPRMVATNHMAALLDLILSKAPTAHIIVGKPTSISRASIGSPAYFTYGTNMAIFCSALQSLAKARRVQGQNVFVADLFSAVDPSTMLLSDGTHPNAAGLSAMAKEWLFRIAAITVRSDRVITPFIDAGSTWRYLDQGLDLGTNWVKADYDDSAWAEGPARLGYNVPGLVSTVGYGPNLTNKYITTYFRRTFVVPASLHYTNLHLRLNRADGALVWLNGQELLRINLPPGPISFLDRATIGIVGDPLHTYYPTNRPIPFLPAGTNILAVEVHKFSPVQPYLSFDLELFGLGEFPPKLAASRDGGDFTLHWPATNNAGYIVVSGTNLAQAHLWPALGGPYLLNGGFYEYHEPLMQSQPGNFYALRYLGPRAAAPDPPCASNSNALASPLPTFGGLIQDHP